MGTGPHRMPVGATEDPHALLPGQVYGHYRILSSLQRGGMGEVVLAEDLESNPTGKRVVIKRLLEDFVDDDSYLAMFREEARITSRLDHPNVVRVLDTPILQGNMCLALEFVPGKNLLQVLRAERARNTTTPAHFAVHMIEQTLRGLHYAHTQVDDDGAPLELVHRDVSPGNILASYEGRVKITDFGVATSSATVASTTAGMVRGTTRYLSPEQIRAGKVTLRSDLFACGVILLELLTGKSVFDKGAIPPTLLAIVRGQRAPVVELLGPELPTLNAVLESVLSINPEQRPSSAAEFADVLLGAGHELGEPVSPLDLGRYLLELFPESATKPTTSSGAHGATYLIEVRDPQQIVVGDPLTPPRSGAQPLNADEFETEDLAQADDAVLAAPTLKLPPTPRMVSMTVPVTSDDIEQQATDPQQPGLDMLAEVDEMQRELSHAQRMLGRAGVSSLDRSSTDDVDPMSDSQAVADAFEKTQHTDVTKPRARWPLFVTGLALGALGMGFALLYREPPQRRGVVDFPDEPPKVAPVAVGDSGLDDAAAADAAIPTAESERVAHVAAATVAVAEPELSFITISGPKGARISIDGVLISQRAPIAKFPVEAGKRKVVIKRRRFRRSIRVVVKAGQHLDLSKDKIRSVED